MKTNVGDKFPESNLYIYNSGNMEKTNTYKIFDNKKNNILECQGLLHQRALIIIYQV